MKKTTAIGLFVFIGAFIIISVIFGLKREARPDAWLIASPSEHTIYSSPNAGAEEIGVLDEKMVVAFEEKLSKDGHDDWLRIGTNDAWIKVDEEFDTDIISTMSIVFPEKTIVYTSDNTNERLKKKEKIEVIAITNQYFICWRDGKVVYIKR